MSTNPTLRHWLDQRDTPLGPDDPTGTRKQHAIAAAVFVALAAAFLLPLFGGQSFSVVEARQGDVYPWAAFEDQRTNPAQFDSADLSYPWQLETQRAFDEGTLPYWSPNVFGGGSVLFSNGTSGVMYPPRAIIYKLAPQRWAHDLFVGFHLVAGGFVAYLLCRELSRSAAASIIAGAAWMLGSFNLAWIHLEVVTSMLVALPLAPLVFHRLWRKQTPGSFALAASGIALTLIS